MPSFLAAANINRIEVYTLTRTAKAAQLIN